ncbi:MAG: FtsX-like permease family protein [Steroidobacteraceae bacterium]
MEIRPILSALLRNRAGALLVGLQIAITLAVAANAAFIIQQRLQKIGRPTGIDTPNTFYLYSYGYAPGYDAKATLTRDLETLRRLPGVVAATSSNSIVLSGSGSSNAYLATPDPKAPNIPGNYFEIGDQGLATWNVRLLEGRNFRPEELTWRGIDNEFPRQVIVSRTMAQALYGTEHAVGRLVYDSSGKAAQIIGVTADMMGSWADAKHPNNIVYHPVLQNAPRLLYAVRSAPGRRAELMLQAQAALARTGDGRFIVWVHPQEKYLQSSYLADHRMVVFLWTIIALMVGVTALGIVGLATFLVNARRKQIGTRRAVGARRIDIVRYFLVENGLLTTFGSAAGVVFAFAFSYWLSNAFELPALPVRFVVGGVVALLVLGQVAVLVPARRAAQVPPAVATRTV